MSQNKGITMSTSHYDTPLNINKALQIYDYQV